MHGSGISIWFFIGVLLTVYGFLICGYGTYEWVSGAWRYSAVTLAGLHAPVWWGAVMFVLGAFYCLKFKPSRG
jgi:hypothetical protein